MIAATLHGPSYGAPSHDESSIEVFNHLGEVIDALYERMHANGRRTCDVRTLDGGLNLTLFPTFGEGMRFTCFKESAMSRLSGAIPEDVVMELLAAVHGGHWDYEVELVLADSGLLEVRVEKP